MCVNTSQEQIKNKIQDLKVQHKDLDLAIQSLNDQSAVEMFTLKRFKKHKLLIRDEIVYLENMLFPDIIA